MPHEQPPEVVGVVFGQQVGAASSGVAPGATFLAARAAGFSGAPATVCAADERALGFTVLRILVNADIV
ncbi:MAG: hypothetical protein RLZZ450_2310 [Pseudomonadota bacterium]